VIDRRGSGHGARVSRVALFSNERGLPAAASRTETDVRFQSLVDAHSDFVWRLLRRLGLTAPDADDATQQVFMIAARRLDSIEAEKARTFLYGTARRVLSNMRRAQRRRRETDDGAFETMVEERPLPDALLEQVRAVSRLDRLLARLPEPLKRVLVLAQIEQASAAEIAALEQIPLGTAASRLRRARAAFRDLLAAETASEKEPH
jgi:RNA polymerase sigma-70 factor, ECF subfamily